ncbi:MAG: Transcriptional regulator containing HTH domain [Candidatus Methanohalarchaeum thermophilum]|uniref:Transcriptional regulator containing HTH domain n=1 Tax=Methanohalarchaeum thermophilum TaxID=1903181 RepID=A0A1Q6DWV9_METT1|nr:MAG: Transcriptional regulator containing HTH domain [Candidatus Methanohalarchaeum thermophilum]
MRAERKLIKAALKSNKEFAKTLKTTITEELKTNISNFSKAANIPASTLYKIVSSEREPNLKTVRKIINTVRELTGEKKKNKFIAIIGTRPVLDKIEKKYIEKNDQKIQIEEYAATSMDEVIISSIRAERDGASALICAPIVSSTIEKIINIPVVTIMPKASLRKAIEIAIKKI